MKRLIAILSLALFAGFGCSGANPSGPAGTDGAGYENEQYGFSFSYPDGLEVRERDEGVRQTEYLGLGADFFASLRDMVRDEKPTNIAFFYAIPNLTVDAFSSALVASSSAGAVKVTSVEDIVVNGVALKKITSTTEIGDSKIHYLLERDGATVVISVFLNEQSAFDPVLQTLRAED